MSSGKKIRKVSFGITSIFFAFVIVVFLIGYYFYNKQSALKKNDVDNYLSSVIESKSKEIINWRNERVLDAKSNFSYPIETDALKDVLSGKSNEISKLKITNWILNYIDIYNEHESVFIFDKNGNQKMVIPDKDYRLNIEEKDLIDSAKRYNKIILYDFYRSEKPGDIHIDIVIPTFEVIGKNSNLLGFFLLRIDPNIKFFDLLQSWPYPTKTGEVLLVQRDNDSVVYLNKLKHINNIPMSLKFSLNEKELPAARIAKGIEGSFEGVDYRGEKVLAATKLIKDSPWGLVVKIDRDEVLSPINEIQYLIIIIGIIILFSGWLAVTIYSKQREIILNKRIAESRNNFDRIFNYSIDMISISGFDGTFKEINPAFTKILGWSKDQFLSKNWFDFVHPEDLQNNNSSLIQLQNGQSIVDFETRFLCLDGTYRWLSCNAFPLAKEKIIFAVIRDITERKQSENRLQESEERYKLLWNSSSDAIYVHTIDDDGAIGKFIEVNSVACNRMGYTIEEFRNMTPMDIDSTDTHNEIPIAVQKLTEEKQILMERIHVTKDGRLIPVEINACLFRMNNKTLAFSIARDITERKEAERLLLENNYKIEIAMQSANMAWWEMDIITGSVKFNKRKTEMLGYPPEQFNHYKDFMALVHPEDYDKLMNAMRAHIEGLFDKYECEYRILSKSGEYRWFYDIGSISNKDTRRESHTVIGFVFDITERKKAESKISSLSHILEYSVNEIYVFDTESLKFLFVNISALKNLGFTQEEMFSLTPVDIKPEFTLESFLFMVDPLLTGKTEKLIFETKHKRKDGTIYIVEVHLQLDNYEGKKAFAAIILDITERKKVDLQIKERMKELQAFYSLAELAARKEISLYELNEEFINSLPKSWQYPEITCARMVVGDNDFRTKNFSESAWKLSTPVKMNGTVSGKIEVGYLEEKPEEDEGPFLKEERLLLDAIAERIGHVSELKQKEEALKESEERFRNAFQYSAIGMALVSLEGKWLKVNSQLCSIVGYSEEELLTKSFQDITHPDDLENDLINAHQLWTGKVKYFQSEKRYFHKNGNIIWVLLNVSLVKNSANTPLYSISQIENITERKMVEQNLKESEEKLKLILDSAAESIYGMDSEGICTFANRSCVEILKYESTGDLIGKKMHDLIHHTKKDGINLLAEECFIYNETRSGRSYHSAQEIFWKADSTSLPVECWAYPIIKNTQNSGAVVTFVDITDRIEAENLIEENRKRYKVLFESANDAIFLIHNNKFFEFNNKALEILKGSREQILESNLLEIIKNDESGGDFTINKLIEYLNRVVNGQPQVFEWKFQRFDGEVFDADVSINKIEFNNDIFFQTIIRDITERKHTVEELRKSEEKYRTSIDDLNRAQAVAKLGNWRWDLKNGHVTWSDEMYHIFGIDKNLYTNNLGGAIEKMIHPDDLHKVLPTNASAFAKKEPLEYRIILPDKSTRFIYAEAGDSILDEEGNPIFLTGISQDITERKQAENELKKLLSAVEQTPASIVITDITGKIEYVNPQFCITTGYSLEESIGNNPRVLKSEYHKPDYYKNLWETVLSGKVWKGELVNKKKNGDLYWENASIAPVVSLDGKITHFVAIKEDITDQIKAKEELKKLSQAIEQSPISTVITNLKGEIEYVNPKFSDMTGYAFDEVIGKNPKILQSGLHGKEFYKNLWDTILSGNVWKGEMADRKKDGKIQWILASFSTINNSEGKITHFISSREDISERKKTEGLRIGVNEILERIASGDDLQLIFKNLIDVVETLEPEMICSILLMSDDENHLLIGSAPSLPDTYNDAINGIEIGPSVGSCGTAAYTGNIVIVDDIATDPKWTDFKELALRYDLRACWSQPIFADYNKVLGTFAIYSHSIEKPNESHLRLIDTMSRIAGIAIQRMKSEKVLIKTKNEAEFANKSKSEFLANMSHEIRTPMNAILGFTDILLGKVTDPEINNFLSIIRTSGDTLLNLINDILDISKIESGIFDLKPEFSNLSRILSELNLIFSQKLDEKRLELIINIEHDFPKSIYIDQVRIRQVMLNLLSNAIKFTESGYIKITVKHQYNNNKKENADITILVEDTGIGIPFDQTEKIFKPFEQVDGQSTRKFGGTGLGLTITSKIINKMGGDISVHSEENKGSTFIITLPNIKVSLDQNTDFYSDKIDNTSIEFEPKKVLIVDDIKHNRDLLRAHLSDLHMDVSEAEDGEKALELIKNSAFDLFVIDMRMPIMDGDELVKILLDDEKTKNIPRILCSASAFKEQEDKYMQYFDGFLPKPNTKPQIINLLKKFIPYHEIIKKQTQVPDISENIQKELETSALSLLELEELIKVLDNEYKSQFELVSKTRVLEDIKEFATMLKETSSKYNLNPLIIYCDQLIKATNQFRLSKIKILLKEFPIFTEKIRSSLRSRIDSEK